VREPEKATEGAQPDPERKGGAGADRVAVILAALGVGSAVLAASGPLWWRLEGPVHPLFWHGLVSGLALLIAGLIGSWWRSGRAVGRLLLVASVLYFLAYVGFGRSDLAYSIGLLISGAWIAVSAHAVVVFPEGRLRSRLERTAIYGIYGWSVTLRVLLVFVDPRDLGCTDCPSNVLLLQRQPGVAAFLVAADAVAAVLLTALVLAIVTRRWLRATRPERRVLTPVFLALAANVAAFMGLALVNALYVAGVVSDVVSEAPIVVERTALMLIPAGMAVGIVRGVLARSAVANLLVRIGSGSPPDDLERDVAWALADPSARLLHRGAGSSWVDATGRPVHVPGSLTEVSSDTDARVALQHDPSLSQDQPELLGSVVAALRLAIQNERLQTAVRLHREIPDGLAERLLREGGKLGESELRTISVVMSDIRGYSTIAEVADPRSLAGQLQEHRTAMSRVVVAHGGTVMQFVGDSVFAVFGAPLSLDGHAVRAIRAAAAMQAAQAEINASWTARSLPVFGLGIGVTTGEVAAALLGSPEHVEYSVVGDVVNLAQRIQGWAAAGEVVVDEATRRAIGDEAVSEPLEPRQVKGRLAAVAAYRLAH
jgi:class 3 adenylate cyclase